SEISHWAESLLSRVRDHEIQFTGKYADLSLRSIDMLRKLLKIVQAVLPGQAMAKPLEYDQLLGLLKDTEAASDQIPDPIAASPRLGDILIEQGSANREEIEEVAAAQGDDFLGLAL